MKPLVDRPVRDGIKRQACLKCGAIRIDRQIGLEETPEAYVEKLVAVFRELRRVLKDDGVLWLNLGDSYWGGKGQSAHGDAERHVARLAAGKTINRPYQEIGKMGETLNKDGKHPVIKPKDLIGIPWMVAFALRADGWWLRQDIIWCLSGGAYIYAKTQKGVLPMMVRDLARLEPATIQLWNGEKWTQLLGMSKSARHGDEVEIVLRSGERISCTPTHKFPTSRGLVEAGSLIVGDIIQTCKLPDVENPRDCAIDLDAAWLAGLYIAEGSHSEDTIQIAGHSKEEARWERICKIAAKYGGSCTRTIDGNQMNIRIHGKVLNAIIDELVTGRVARDKGFSPSVWKYSNDFIASMLDGYLSGDGHYEVDNNRWRLGFTRNYNLERDLRTACARLGYRLTLNLATVEYQGRQVPTFRGELRKERTGHHNEKDMGEIVEIRKSKCREVYDLGIADEPHLFSLASGVLTHNSKPNSMPESVTDRCTKSHEYIFLLTKSARYYYNAEAIYEPAAYDGRKDTRMKGSKKYKDGSYLANGNANSLSIKGRERWRFKNLQEDGQQPNTIHERRAAGLKDGVYAVRNKRDVWTVSTRPYKEAHFATFPPELPRLCILAGSRPGDTILDPFAGSGTTLFVAKELGRHWIGMDISEHYCTLARKRIAAARVPLFT